MKRVKWMESSPGFRHEESLTRRCSSGQLVERVHGEGGIIVAAHPYKLSRNGRTRYYGAGDRIYDLQIDAMQPLPPDHHDQAVEKIRRAMEILGHSRNGGERCAQNIFDRHLCDRV